MGTCEGEYKVDENGRVTIIDADGNPGSQCICCFSKEGLPKRLNLIKAKPFPHSEYRRYFVALEYTTDLVSLELKDLTDIEQVDVDLAKEFVTEINKSSSPEESKRMRHVDKAKLLISCDIY